MSCCDKKMAKNYFDSSLWTGQRDFFYVEDLIDGKSSINNNSIKQTAKEEKALWILSWRLFKKKKNFNSYCSFSMHNPSRISSTARGCDKHLLLGVDGAEAACVPAFPAVALNVSSNIVKFAASISLPDDRGFQFWEGVINFVHILRCSRVLITGKKKSGLV